MRGNPMFSQELEDSYWIAKRHGTAEGNESYRTVRRLESDDLIRWRTRAS